MFEYIKGIYVGLSKDYVILENNNIGYKIYTSGNTMANMPSIDNEVKLYIEQIVKEDFIGLYGFLTEKERDMFNLLLTINGVGRKSAMSLLSISSVENLKIAILSEDYKILTRAPGIGKKTAQRIILELKDKVEVEKEVIDNIENGEHTIENSEKYKQALQGLISLGFSEKESENAIKHVDCDMSLEQIVKSCLKYLIS